MQKAHRSRRPGAAGTWYFGLPTSSSHALIGGYAGAGIAKAGTGVLIPSGWTKTLIFIVLTPRNRHAAGVDLHDHHPVGHAGQRPVSGRSVVSSAG